jgi:DICT domain-containing protein
MSSQQTSFTSQPDSKFPKNVLALLEKDYKNQESEDKYFHDKYAAVVNAVADYEWYKTRPQKMERMAYNGGNQRKF